MTRAGRDVALMKAKKNPIARKEVGATGCIALFERNGEEPGIGEGHAIAEKTKTPRWAPLARVTAPPPLSGDGYSASAADEGGRPTIPT